MEPRRFQPGKPASLTAREQVKHQAQRFAIQPKIAAFPQKHKPPIAPPAYRPQATPLVLQRKAVGKQQTLACQSKSTGAKSAVCHSPATHRANAIQAQMRNAKPESSVSPVPQNNSRQVIQRSKYKYEKEFEQYASYASSTKNSAKISRRIKDAQKALIYTQEKLIHGPGNIREAVEESKGRNMSAVRVARMEARVNYGAEDSVRRAAIAARRARGGNCDEHGMITFYRLVHQADVNDYAYLCGNGWHVFAILADPPGIFGFDKATAVVADAWLGPSFAVSFEHWRYNAEGYSVLQKSRCYGGAAEGDLLKQMRVQDLPSKSDRSSRKRSLQDDVEGSAAWLYKNPQFDGPSYPRKSVLTPEIEEEVKKRGAPSLMAYASGFPKKASQIEEDIFGPRTEGDFGY